MGEIKSTLDLVMEKTRHMSMSRQERNAQREEEVRKSLRGLIQKHTDGRLRTDRLLTEFDKLDKLDHKSNQRLLMEECLDRIQIGGEFAPVLELLEFGCKVDVKPLTELLQEYSRQRTAAELESERDLKNKLDSKLQIAGTAVVPNLETDVRFEERLGRLNDDFGKRLQAQKERLLA